jgi:hypothetical protein
MCASLGLKEQLVLEHHPPLHPTTHPQRHLTIFHLAFPPENTHTQQDSANVSFDFYFILFRAYFFFVVVSLSPHVCGRGFQYLASCGKEKNFSFAFFWDVEKKSAPFDDGQHMPLR